MKVHNITIGNVNFDNYFQNNLVIQDLEFTGDLRTEIIYNKNTNGGIVGPALGNNRLFTFKGKIFGNKAQSGHGIKILEDLLNIFDGFVQMTWTDNLGVRYKTMVKTYSLPQITGNLEDWIYDFSFEMISNRFEFLGYEDKVVRGTLGTYENYFGGTNLPTILGTHLGNYKGLQVINNGNHLARCKIELIGQVVNPIIINGDTQSAYRLNYTTTHLILDNTKDELIVTDIGINIKQYRKSGSLSIYLKPGVNNIILLRENNTDGVKLNVFYNDTYK